MKPSAVQNRRRPRRRSALAMASSDGMPGGGRNAVSGSIIALASAPGLPRYLAG